MYIPQQKKGIECSRDQLEPIAPTQGEPVLCLQGPYAGITSVLNMVVPEKNIGYFYLSGNNKSDAWNLIAVEMKNLVLCIQFRV